MKFRSILMLTIVLIIGLCLPIAVNAEMLDKDADPPVISASGSFESTYQTRMDFSLTGGSLSEAKWTRTQMFVGYTLIGTYKEGETVSLSLTGIQSPVPDTNSNATLVFNSLNVKMTFRDANQRIIGEEQQYQSGNVKESPLSHQMGAAFPAGTKSVVISGTFNCRWTTSVVAEESVSVTVQLKVEDASGGILPTQPEPGPTGETPRDGDPWQPADPLTTALIAIASAGAAIVAAAFGSSTGTAAATGAAAAAQDPAYKRDNVPEYPAFVVGLDGEHITKMPNGTIEISFPTGEKAIHFPNGTVQVQNPDGSTWEEWPDGTISTSDHEGFFVKRPDGTIAQVDPNGEEIIFNPDGTSVQITKNGMRITKSESGVLISAIDPEGMIWTRHPEDPDALIITSPHGGSLVMKAEEKWVIKQNSEGRLERELIDHQVLEGEIRTEDMTLIYKPDGSVEGRGDDGSWLRRDGDGNLSSETSDGSKYEEFPDGRVSYQGADGTYLKGNRLTGEIDFKAADGSFIKGNANSGEVDARMADGSYWKRDAQGNGSFVDKTTGTKGVCRSDRSFSVENDDASLTQDANGTIEFKTTEGVLVSEKADGSVRTQLPDGRSSLDTPDGSKTINMPDGTAFQKAPDGTTQIRRPDGSAQRVDPETFGKELERYNDWYNKQLAARLNK